MTPSTNTTATDSSSSADALSEGFREACDPWCEIDLAAAGKIAPLPRAFLEGQHLDLLAPLRFVRPGVAEPPPEPPSERPDRREVARALAVANRGWGHPRADELSEKLADPATRVVVSGQQPGLLGGPLLSMVKMLATVLWAERLEAAGGGPVVPVFWVATEDHDWAELSRARLIDRDGVRDVDLGDDPTPLLPVGMRTFGSRLPAVLEILADTGPGALGDARSESVLAAYRPDARFGEAFCRFHASLLGRRAPLFLDAMLPELKQAQRPWLRALVERRNRVASELAHAHAKLEERGLPLQVAPQPGTSPLFLLHRGERRRIVWEGDARFSLRGSDEDPRLISELLAVIDENPTAVTPGVLARPMIQDATLGTTLQVMGPSEVSYLAQASGVYRALDRPGPWTTLRPRGLVLEPKHREHLRDLGVPLAEVLDRVPDDVIHDRFGSDLTGPVRDRIRAAFDDLRPAVLAVDPNLASPVEKTRDHALRGLDKLEGKIRAAEGRRHSIWRDRIEAIRATAAPDGVDQERSVAAAHFLVRYGETFPAAIEANLGLDPRRLRVTILDASGARSAPESP